MILLCTGILVYLAIHFKYYFLFDIKVRTICMQKPKEINQLPQKRNPVNYTDAVNQLILQENLLRKQAYKNSNIKTGASFFDDSDMEGEYYLLIVYHKKSGVPLLSARYYFGTDLIAKVIKGDTVNYNKETHFNALNIKESARGSLFLADRLSANVSSSIYRRYRKYIHSLFYSELKAQNRRCNYIIMARKEKRDKLLSNYLGWGLKTVGITKHNGRDHWILCGNLKQENLQIYHMILLTILVFLRRLFYKKR